MLQWHWKPQTTCPTIRLFTHLDANSHWPIYTKGINGCLALCSIPQHCSCSSALCWLACLNADKASTYSRHGRTCIRFLGLQHPQTIRVTKPVGNKRLSGTKRCNQFPSDLSGGLFSAYRVELQVFRLGLSWMTSWHSLPWWTEWTLEQLTEWQNTHLLIWLHVLDFRDLFPI